jgi:polyphosphate kinase
MAIYSSNLDEYFLMVRVAALKEMREAQVSKLSKADGRAPKEHLGDDSSNGRTP